MVPMLTWLMGVVMPLENIDANQETKIQKVVDDGSTDNRSLRWIL